VQAVRAKKLLSLTANNLNVSILEDKWPSIFERIEEPATPSGDFFAGQVWESELATCLVII
jgi:hypothetical protein